MQGLIKAGEEVDAGQANNVNLAQTLNHEGFVIRVRQSFLISVESSWQELSEVALQLAVQHAVRNVVQVGEHVSLVRDLLDHLVDLATRG